MLRPLGLLRDEVRALGPAALETLPPVLVARETIEGDLSFTGPDRPASRPGATLLLEEGPVSPRERMAAPQRPGRKALPDERYLPFTPVRDGAIRVGRAADNDVVLKDPSVSSHHATLYRVPQTNWCFVVDQASRNGCAINDVRLRGGARGELASGDELAIGRIVFVYMSPVDLYDYLVG